MKTGEGADPPPRPRSGPTTVLPVNPPRPLWLAVASVAALTLLAGCSGSNDSSADSSAAGVSSSASASVAASAPASPDGDGDTTGDGKAFEHNGVTVAGEPGAAPEVSLAEDFAEAADLDVVDIVEGTGDPVPAGGIVTVHYVGVGEQSRAEFDSSWQRNQPITFSLDQVIEGWQQGMVGMKTGGRRLLVIPGKLGYGPDGAPPTIGPDETLVFVVDLVDQPAA